MERYPLKEVCIRITKGRSLYSDRPISTPQEAVAVMQKELSQYDREVICVVNVNSQLQPINYHVVSVGTVDSTVAYIPNIMKSGILSNASGFVMLHNHPAGTQTPSREDLALTKRVIEAGKICGIKCIDHIIVADEIGYSMRENNYAEFDNDAVSMAAEEILSNRKE